MGALHAGHASLIESAHHDCDFVVVSIFVNPTQFAPHEDLAKYPRPFSADVDVCQKSGASLIFHPQPATIYPPGCITTVEVPGLSSLWEGVVRPTHFKGVTTVVLKLLNIVQPDISYFGRKDFQQQLIIKRMCRDLDWPFEIRTCPTLRDPDGLAMSSRNVYLSAEQRQAGLSISKALFQTAERMYQGARDIAVLRGEMQRVLIETPGLVLDYAAIVDSSDLTEVDHYHPGLTAIIAARVGTTRLIDNLELP